MREGAQRAGAETFNREELVVAMALVPGLLSRNRSFALFEDPNVRRARRRALALCAIVRQLADCRGNVQALRIARGTVGYELSYNVPAIKVRRRALLSALEAACVRYLAQRSGVSALHASEEDRSAIDAALRRLASGPSLDQIDSEMTS
ncbi:MAG: hypothetical protein M3O50_18435 [Myxococcota bacterium]|nr:hypothetical protein [Myxococcota bacterium]